MGVFDIYSKFKTWHVIVTVVFFVGILLIAILSNTNPQFLNSSNAIPLFIIITVCGFLSSVYVLIVPRSIYVKTGELRVSNDAFVISEEKIQFNKIANIKFTIKYGYGLGLYDKIKITDISLNTYEYKFVTRSGWQRERLKLICAKWHANGINVMIKKGLFG